MRFGEHDLNSTIDCDDVGKCNPEPFTRNPEKIIVHEEYDFVKNRGANPNDIGENIHMQLHNKSSEISI